LKTWTQEELAVYRMLGEWDKLWEATLPLVKSEYGRMVRLGHVSEPQDKGDDHWLNEGMLIAGEAMRKWDPAKGAYSTYIVSHLRTALPMAVRKDARGGITARDYGVSVSVVSLQDQRPGVDANSDDPDDDGTYDATLAYAEAPEELGDPVEEASRIEVQTRLAVALASLPVEEREALIATQIEAVGAYATRTGIDPATVWRRVRRARSKVQELMGTGV
jgi:RNA polymerase sigma factor (sigma-70 family)